MLTVQEILKSSGFSDKEIENLDARAINAFTGVVSTVDNERKAAADALATAEETRKAAEKAEAEARQRAERAELLDRSNKDFYDGTIVPALTGWEQTRQQIEIEKAKAVAEAAFYKTQAEEAKKSGFITAEAPSFSFVPPVNSVPSLPTPPQPSRDGQGRYMPNVPGSVPGSPTLLDDVRSALSDTTWTMQQYQQLYGTIYPGDVMQDAAEAQAMKLPYREHVARKYKFSEQRAELQRKEQEKHDAEVRAAAEKEWQVKLQEREQQAKLELEKARQEWAERSGNNPDMRAAVPSKLGDAARAVKEGNRPDPLTLNTHERHNITRKQINERISSQESAA